MQFILDIYGTFYRDVLKFKILVFLDIYCGIKTLFCAIFIHFYTYTKTFSISLIGFYKAFSHSLCVQVQKDVNEMYDFQFYVEQ